MICTALVVVIWTNNGQMLKNEILQGLYTSAIVSCRGLYCVIIDFEFHQGLMESKIPVGEGVRDIF